ncbi:sigma-54 dependent transcriptional regulator [Tissierella sp. MSJ-40]|uniref:Sigma-54 dependent transcriptional regulator n=1 Tax=Tissierella simiarum TaxID=2841534 RepID=A0ABS6E6N6_9FIRM|nr:sigma-54 dependent transcriptional regulator [Tissierella simiarum]MBU5438585.1 sigma-54 dependent transcriptional regulator [Tissierella simiarum]
MSKSNANRKLWEIDKKEMIDKYGIVVEDYSMLELMTMVKKISKVDSTVLILGETGVGKEVVAKFIHKNSSRNKNKFRAINCGTISQSLIESELFGYESGAFTGANKNGKEGLLEAGNGGTILLDEIGELPLNIQVKLLRVLQEKCFERVGGIDSIQVDVRIIAIANRNLSELVKKGLFREDLYYRLNVIPIIVPPLRERREDIIPLINYFLQVFNKTYNENKKFSQEALEVLYNYSWYGNVREVRNIVEQQMIINDEDIIQTRNLPPHIKMRLKL